MNGQFNKKIKEQNNEKKNKSVLGRYKGWLINSEYEN